MELDVGGESMGDDGMGTASLPATPPAAKSVFDVSNSRENAVDMGRVLRMEWKAEYTAKQQALAAAWNLDSVQEDKAGNAAASKKVPLHYVDQWMARELVSLEHTGFEHAYAMEMANVNGVLSGMAEQYMQFDACREVYRARPFSMHFYLMVTSLSYAMLEMRGKGGPNSDPTCLGYQYNGDEYGRQTWMNLYIVDYKIDAPSRHRLLVTDGICMVWVHIDPASKFVSAELKLNFAGVLLSGADHRMSYMYETFVQRIIGKRATLEVRPQRIHKDADILIVVADNLFIGQAGHNIKEDEWRDGSFISFVENSMFGSWCVRYNEITGEEGNETGFGYWPAPCLTATDELLWGVGLRRATLDAMLDSTEAAALQEDMGAKERGPGSRVQKCQAQRHGLGQEKWKSLGKPIATQVRWTVTCNTWETVCSDVLRQVGKGWQQTTPMILCLTEICFVPDAGLVLKVEDQDRWMCVLLSDDVLLGLEEKCKVVIERHGRRQLDDVFMACCQGDIFQLFPRDQGRALLVKTTFGAVQDSGFCVVQGLEIVSQFTIFAGSVVSSMTNGVFDNMGLQFVDILLYQYLSRCKYQHTSAAEPLQKIFALGLGKTPMYKSVDLQTKELLRVACDRPCMFQVQDLPSDILEKIMIRLDFLSWANLVSPCVGNKATNGLSGNVKVQFEVVLRNHLSLGFKSPTTSMTLAKNIDFFDVDPFFEVDDIMDTSEWLKCAPCSPYYDAGGVACELTYGDKSEVNSEDHDDDNNDDNDLLESESVSGASSASSDNEHVNETGANNQDNNILHETESDDDAIVDYVDHELPGVSELRDAWCHAWTKAETKTDVTGMIESLKWCYAQMSNEPTFSYESTAQFITSSWPLFPGTLNMMSRTLMLLLDQNIEGALQKWHESTRGKSTKMMYPHRVTLDQSLKDQRGEECMQKLDWKDVFPLLRNMNNWKWDWQSPYSILERDVTAHVWTANLKIEGIFPYSNVYFLRDETKRNDPSSASGANGNRGWHQIFSPHSIHDVADIDIEDFLDRTEHNPKITIICSDGLKYIPLLVTINTLRPLLEHLKYVHNLQTKSLADVDNTRVSFLQGCIVQVDIHVLRPILIDLEDLDLLPTEAMDITRVLGATVVSRVIMESTQDVRTFPQFETPVEIGSTTSLTAFAIPKSENIRLIFSATQKKYNLSALVSSIQEQRQTMAGNVGLVSISESAPLDCVLTHAPATP